MKSYANAAKQACDELRLKCELVAGHPDFIEATLADGGEYVQLASSSVWFVTNILSEKEKATLNALKSKMNFSGALKTLD